MPLGQQQPYPTVVEDMRQALFWRRRVQRQVGAAGLEDRQQADQHVQRTLQRQPDRHIRANATGDQAVRQAIGPRIQFAVAQPMFVEDQRNRLRPLPRLLLETLLQGALHRVLALGRVPFGEGLPALRRIQQRQLAEPLSWVGDDAAQQVAPMAGQAFHGGGVEQIGGIVEGGPDAVFVFLNIQRQVELRSLAVPGQAFQTQVLQLNLGRHRAYLALMVEQHLEQWVVAGIALRLQGFHQLLERRVLVRLGLQRALAGLGQQLVEAHPTVQVGLEHLGVDEEADQPLGLHAVAIGDRHTDTDIRLPAVAIQQRLERGQQQHETTGAFTLGQGSHGLDQFPW